MITRAQAKKLRTLYKALIADVVWHDFCVREKPAELAAALVEAQTSRAALEAFITSTSITIKGTKAWEALTAPGGSSTATRSRTKG